MPNPTIVHVGLPKTASTWFQKNFYPHLRRPGYVPRPAVNAAFLEGNALTFDAAEAMRTLGLDGGAGGVLCEEGLCGYLHNGGVAGAITKEVAARIRATLPDAQIVLFLRAQPRILVAAYQQYVRAGGTHAAHRYFFPGDYLVGPNAVGYKQPRFEIDFFAYAPLVAFYDSVFGRARVHVFLYEEFRGGGEAFLRRFAGQLGLEIDWAGVSTSARHASYGYRLTQLARVLNLFSARSVSDKARLVHIPGWHQPRRQLLEALNRTGLFGRPPNLERLVGRDTARWLADRYAADNRRLLALRDLPLAAHGYPLDAVPDRPDRARAARWRRQLAR